MLILEKFAFSRHLCMYIYPSAEVLRTFNLIRIGVLSCNIRPGWPEFHRSLQFELDMFLQDLSEYFTKMKEMSQKRGEISSRVRFMLRDVIDLRQGKWIPRRSDSNPKTMDQIQKEAEKETLYQQILPNSAPQAPRQQDDRASTRKNSESFSLMWTSLH